MPAPRITIDQLPEQTVVSDDDYLVVQDGTTSKKMTVGHITTQSTGALNAHINDTTGAHNASAIAAVPNISPMDGSDVQTQLAQAAAAFAAGGGGSGGSGDVPQSRVIGTALPLTGGGNLAADRTIGINAFVGSAPGAVPTSAGGSTNFLRADGAWAAPPSGGGVGVTDGDKGEITVSNSGATWVVDNSTITNAKLANTPSSTVKGRVTAGVGPVEDLSAAQVTNLLSTFTPTAKGLAPPATGGGTTNFLRADGTWAAPPSGTAGIAGVQVKEDDTNVVTAATSIDFGNGFDVSAVANEANIFLDLSEYEGPTLPQDKVENLGADLAGKINADSPVFTGTVTFPSVLTGVLRADTGTVSVDTDVTDVVAAASTTAAGKVELATTAEATAQTDNVRAVTPLGLADRVLTSRAITTTAPLTGGGSLTTNLSLGVNAFSTTTTAAGVVPGSNGAGATAYLNGAGEWTIPGGSSGGVTPVVAGYTTAPVTETVATGGTVVLTTPAGAAIGDTLLAVICSQISTATIDVGLPAGWARVGLPFVANDAAVRVLGFYRLTLTATPAASYTFTTYAANRSGGILLHVTDLDPVAPVSASSAAYGTRATGSDPTMTLGGVTSPSPNSLYLLAALGNFSAGITNSVSTSPTGMTLISDLPIGVTGGSFTRLTLWKQAVEDEAIPSKAVTWGGVPSAGTGSGLVLRGTSDGGGGGGGGGPVTTADITDMTAIGVEVATAATLTAAQEAVGIITIVEGAPIPGGTPAGTLVIVVPA